MNATADLEISVLRRIEARQQSESEEADRLIRALLPVYACDFVIAQIPDDHWVALPPGWQSGLSEAVVLWPGYPPKTYSGSVGLTLRTLRSLATISGVSA